LANGIACGVVVLQLTVFSRWQGAAARRDGSFVDSGRAWLAAPLLLSSRLRINDGGLEELYSVNSTTAAIRYCPKRSTSLEASLRASRQTCFALTHSQTSVGCESVRVGGLEDEQRVIPVLHAVRDRRTRTVSALQMSRQQ
jgi:hypothetical protein